MSLPASWSGTPARRTPWLIAFALVLSFALTGTSVTAHSNANHGTIKVHDEETASPETRNEPHVDCDDFWIEGFNMSDDSGDIVIYSWPPTGDKTEVLNEGWEANSGDQEEGFGFLAGPFSLEEGHYRVEAFVDHGHFGNTEHFSKAKMFWVDCGGEELPCPPGLLAVTTEDGGILLTWTDAEGSDATNVYRSVDGGDFELLTTVDAGVEEYLDEDILVRHTYAYTVTGLFGNRESTGCEEVEVSVIPDFPTMVALAAATILGTAGYAFVTRRKR